METAFEKILTTTFKEETVAYFISHEECFEEAIQLALIDKQPYSWRASWLLWSCMKNNDARIKKHLKKLINTLPHRKYNQQRELLKVFELMDLDEDDEGNLFNSCMVIWEKIESQPSVRQNAFKILIKIAKKHPDLIHELKLLTQEYYLLSLSPGIKKCVNKLLHEVSYK